VDYDESAIDYLVQSHKLGKKVTTEHLWCGRHVKVIDGSTVSMPDTEALHCVEVDFTKPIPVFVSGVFPCP